MAYSRPRSGSSGRRYEAIIMRVALINAPLKSAVSDYGVGHQMPLGLLMVGGPLLDAGHQVKLIDAARDHLSDKEIIRRVAEFQADVAMTAHVGSTSAHPCAVRLLGAIKTALPDIVTVYGGVHPTYRAFHSVAKTPPFMAGDRATLRSSLRENPVRRSPKWYNGIDKAP
jgi:B12 binding domain